jgi:glycosyltransferase involved in cell wall biosynthesis
MDAFPKTLFFEVAHRFGGSGTRLIVLMKNLPKDRIALACLSSSETANALRPLGYTIYEIGNNKFDPMIPVRVAKILNEEKFEVFDTQNIQSKILGSIVVKLNPVTFVSTVNSTYMKEYGDNIKGRLYHLLDIFTNRNLDHIVAVSAEVQTMLVDAGVDQDQISLIRNSVDVTNEEVIPDPGWLKKSFNIPSESQVGVAIGRLEWVKGFDVLISAMKIITAKVPNFHCLIVGDGPQRQKLEEMSSEYGVDNHIIFAGFQPLSNVYNLLKSSDMMIMPSRSEGTPMALLEAASFSSAIIASNVGGIPDVVSDGSEAVLVPPEDAKSLADGIVLLCKDSSLKNRLGIAARARVKSAFAPAAQVQALAAAYQNALNHFSQSKPGIGTSKT